MTVKKPRRAVLVGALVEAGGALAGRKGIPTRLPGWPIEKTALLTVAAGLPGWSVEPAAITAEGEGI